MKLKIKVIVSSLLLSSLLTACGSAIEPVTSADIPIIDEPPAKSAEVSSNKASDSVNAVLPASDGVGNDEIKSAETSPIVDGTVTASQTKPEFSFVPDYDESFFENDLFIGDSITTGYSGYGILDEKNVFAKIGLNPLSALDTEIKTSDGDYLLSDEVALKKPKRAYIMLGSNGIDWLACSNMLDGISDIVDAVHDASPETQVICLTIPPITKDYKSETEGVTARDVMEKIGDYNERLASLCDDKEIQCIDITTMLEDSEGYFVNYYAEVDGMHFKPTAYKMILTKIQYTLE